MTNIYSQPQTVTKAPKVYAEWPFGDVLLDVHAEHSTYGYDIADMVLSGTRISLISIIPDKDLRKIEKVLQKYYLDTKKETE